MSVTPFDHPLLKDLLGDEEIALQFVVEEEYEHMFYFEEALSRALAEEGIIPAEAAEIGPGPFEPDAKLLSRAAARDGVIGPEYVRQLREWVGEPQARHVHFGATSQDLVDTSLILRLRPVLDIYEERLKRLATSLADLDRRFGDKLVMGRTRMQDAMQIRFGERIATWHGPLGRHLARLAELRPRLLVLQFGGAVGTLHNYGDKAEAVARRLADKLDLAFPVRSWHSQRDNLGEFASWLSLVTGTLGKMGEDISLMAQNAVGEILLEGGGGSSAMPHKQNPVKAEVLVTLARYNAVLVSAMHHALVHEQERSGTAWTLEWLTLPQMAVTTGAALRTAAELIGSVRELGHG